MKEILQRNIAGEVTLNNGSSTVSATIPKTYSALGIIATNGIVNKAKYSEDGWIYLNGKKLRKWHISYDGIRIWEPRFKQLKELYRLYKKTQKANDAVWKEISDILKTIWKHRRGKEEIKIHATPIHHRRYTSDPENYVWEYTISNGYGQLSFGFNWVNTPKSLVLPDLAQLLYEREHRTSESTGKRAYKVKQIFFEAMKRSLPKATPNKVLCLKFGKDTFWFFTQSKGFDFSWWEMWNERCSFEIKKIM